MRIWQYLFGTKTDKTTPPPTKKITPKPPHQQARKVLKIEPSGNYTADIVGESFYQDALVKIAGKKKPDGHKHKCIARLEFEPKNPYDPNAVAIKINGLKVGHLSKSDAISWKRIPKLLGRDGAPVEVHAIIVGGWLEDDGYEGSFGVKLDFGLAPLS